MEKKIRKELIIQRSCIAYRRKKGGAQLVFAPRSCYVLSVAVWWYILVRLFGEIIVSQGLMQAETTVSRKASTWSKGNNDGNNKKLE